MSSKQSARLTGKISSGARAKKPDPKLTDLQKNFCLNYVLQGRYNGAGALEAAGSRAKYASRRAIASKWLTMVNICDEIRRLNAKADKKARNKEDHALVSVAERKVVLSQIIRATADCLRGISLENGSLDFEDESCRSAVIVAAQVTRVPDPNNPGKKTHAILINLTLCDRIKAIQELNRMEGVYKESHTLPAEIHIHMDKTIEPDEKMLAQINDPLCRAAIQGTASDLSRFRKVGSKPDPFAALLKKSDGPRQK